MTVPVRILLITGSTRQSSTNTAALRAIEDGAPPGIVAVRYPHLAELPAFNPDHDGDDLPPLVAALRAEIAAADAVLFCTPEYAGALPGTFKNLLDWTVGGGEMYGKPVAWINVAPEPRATQAHASLATVLGYLGTAIVEPACRRIPVPRTPDGTISAPTRAALLDTLTTLANHTTQ